MTTTSPQPSAKGTQRASDARSNRTMRSVAFYLLVALITLGVCTVSLQLWKADWHVPFEYVRELTHDAASQRYPASNHLGDAGFNMMLFKTMTQHGWFLSNPQLGAPFGQELDDFPMPESASIAIGSLLCQITGNYALAINLYYIVGFVLVSCSAVFCFRRLSIRPSLALACGILYAFLPYHFMRGQIHLFLGLYWCIPPILLTAIWTAQGKRFVRRRTSRRSVPLTRRGWIALAAAILCGCSGVYYVAFAVYVLVIAAATAILRRHRRSAWINVSLPIALLVVTFLCNMVPFIVHRLASEPNPQLSHRNALDSETFGLKLIQLLLPVEGHRIPAIAELTEAYNRQWPVLTEGRMSSLGAVGVLGLMILFAVALAGPRRSRLARDLTCLSRLNIALILLGTIGGVGMVISFFVNATIRSYCRVSILIAFLCIAAVGLLVEIISIRYLRPRWAAVITPALAVILLVIGLADQVTPQFVPAYDKSLAAYQSDDAFVKSMESRLPADSAILQIPFIPFPEGGGEVPYESIIPYLHSSQLRWSFGSMRGREASTAIHDLAVSAGDAGRFASLLRQSGYAAVCLDRALLTNPAAVENALQASLGAPVLESPNKRFLFYTPPATPGR